MHPALIACRCLWTHPDIVTTLAVEALCGTYLSCVGCYCRQCWLLLIHLTGLVVQMQDAQAGRNVIECLLRYLDKGGHWADTSVLRNTAIGITRKVSHFLPL